MLARWTNANIMKNCCFVCQKRDFKRFIMFSGVFGKHLGCPMGVLDDLGGPKGSKRGPKRSKRSQKGVQKGPKGDPKGPQGPPSEQRKGIV